MATILKKKDQDVTESTVSTAAVGRKEREPMKKETELCEVFIREFNAVDGWTCYPEAAGFDVLVVHDDGRQIGVEAKLALNAKVADQVLPRFGEEFNGRAGPDHRLVIVSKITESNAGIAKMLLRLGVKVLQPRQRWERTGYEWTFDLEHQLLCYETGHTFYGHERMFDWSPAERCQVPALITDLPAGVPSPVRLTPWKESALKIVALMRRQGHITVKQITSFGISPTSWTQPNGPKPAWLAKGAVRGLWVETEHMPAFDKQHPDMYELAVKCFDDDPQKTLALL